MMKTAYEIVELLDFFFSSRRRHTRYWRDWSSDVCSSDLINFNLGEFVKSIQILVSKIESQYSVLEEENNNLQKVRDISLDATKSIQTVSKSMIKTIDDLSRESDTISQIYNNIESLSAIAEENSILLNICDIVR